MSEKQDPKVHAPHPGKLCIRAKGSAMVQNLEALEAGIKRFHCRKFVELSADCWAFIPTDETEQCVDRAEYRRAVAEGDLWAGCEHTAKLCGVKFDPSFKE